MSLLSTWSVYKRLLIYTNQFRGYFLLGAVGFILYALTQMLWAELIEYIVDAIEQKLPEARLIIPLAIVGIFLLRGIGSFLGTYGITYVARQVVHTLRLDLFKKLLYVSPDYYQKNTQGRILSKITYNVEQVAAASADAFKVIIQEGFTVIGLLSYLFYRQWQLTLTFLLITPLIALCVRFASKRLSMISRRIQESMGDVAHGAAEVINGYQTVKLYAAEQQEMQRFQRFSQNNLRQSLKLAVTASLNTPIVQLIVAAILAFIVWLALDPSIFGVTTAGGFLAYITAAAALAKPIRQLTQINTALQTGIAASHSIFEVLDLESEPNKGERQFEATHGQVAFESVSFSYAADYPVLNELSFTAQSGKTLAIVGLSGSGKSTVLKLIPRFLNPASGRIMIDGVSTSEMDLAALRSCLSFVDQRVSLFNASIRENIAYGELSDKTDEQVWAALQSAQAADFVKELPQGLSTLLGEEGVQLSGGQQQRVVLARALLKNAPILILDEATSALDSQSERAVATALETLRQGRTTIVVAHRLATVQHADQIIVLEKGCLKEQGTHQELLSADGLYANLFRLGSEASTLEQ